ncbi:MAG TPA: PaaI family thioesterase [bacterium]|nr:PaaI family thioesterase [bacterium]
MELKGDDYCFGCGAANPVGLRLQFDVDAVKRSAEATFKPRPEHQGYTGVTHGGIIATLLDEAMLKLCWELGIPAVTARLEVELKRPVPVGEELRVRGWIAADRVRMVEAEAEIRNSSGELVARGRSTAVVKGPRRRRGRPSD